MSSSGAADPEDEAECALHSGKRIEAYCVLDKRTICIECILSEEHKNHEIVSLSKGAEKERESLFGAGAKITSLGEALRTAQAKIAAHLAGVRERSSKNEADMSTFFREVHTLLAQRESELRNNAKQAKEREESFCAEKSETIAQY